MKIPYQMEKILGKPIICCLSFFFFGGSEKWIVLPGAHSLSVKDGHGKFLEIQTNKGVIFDLSQYLSHVRKAVITLWDEGL